MSNYHALARHPITGKIEMADWLDDSFGHHIYGVRFPGDATIYRSTQCNEVSLHEAGVEIERLRAALEKIANGSRDADLSYLDLFVELKLEARAALAGEKTDATN